MTQEKEEKTSTDEMVKAYREKWGVSEDEATKQVQRFLSKKPVDRRKATPSVENLFPEPVGPISEKVQDINQAALSTAFTRKNLRDMNQPPQEIEALKGDMDSVKREMSGMLELVNNTMRDMQKTLEGKQAEEARQQLITELEERVIKPIKDDLETVKDKLEKEEPPPRVEESIKNLREKVQSAETDARQVLEDLGYPAPEKKVVVAEAPPSPEPSTEELIETLQKKGYNVEYTMISREEALELMKAAQEKAQEDLLDDQRIKAVTDIVAKAIDRIFDMFTEPLQKWMEGSMETRREGGGGASESRQEEPSASQPS